MKEKSLDGEVYSEEYVKMKLKAHYGDSICMTSKSGKWTLCSRGTVSRILNDKWYEDKLKNITDERMRIVEAAAILIKVACEYDNYPSVEQRLYWYPGQFAFRTLFCNGWWLSSA
ncbi:unnamed protein product [Ceutorhynchus assimilis]|uniref:Uncharacterized protein n=1 Tax=Ceutorhynchus assimilis TaxID=467358 RepID=A0A9N9M958_9CUCU|nr:unnamed protein product [Ceutorhynchus assimilis]